MKRLIALAALLLLPLEIQAEPQKNTSPEEIVKSNVESCKAAGLKRGDDANSVISFCNCMGQVFSDNFTLSDFKAIEKAAAEKKNLGDLSQFKRIQPNLQACKEREKRKPSLKDRIAFVQFDKFTSNKIE